MEKPHWITTNKNIKTKFPLPIMNKILANPIINKATGNKIETEIYGTGWASQKDLDNYLKRIEEAEKRDHRKLGKEMDLFHFREGSDSWVSWGEWFWKIHFRKNTFRTTQKN